MKEQEYIDKFTCHECKKLLDENAEYHDYNNGFIKCRKCHEADPVLRDYQETEVYSRVVGYIRQVKAWNPGKQEEFDDRVVYKVGNTNDLK